MDQPQIGVYLSFGQHWQLLNRENKLRLTRKALDVIPSGQLMQTDVQSQIQELEAKIAALRSSQLAELQERLKEARQEVHALEAEIARISGKAAPVIQTRRKRTSSEEVRGRILKALSESPEGLSQKEISERTELNYNTVVLYLKHNSKLFKTTGALRSKRYFLR